MTPHQSPALRESAADSFSSRRSRLHSSVMRRGHLSAMRREGDDTSSVTRLAGDRRLTASPQGEAEGSSSVMRRGHLPPAGGRR